MTKEDNKTHFILFTLTAITLAMHLTVNAIGQYEIFRDELYYIACSHHPSFGYVDHPPLSIWLLTLWRTLFTDSVFSIRILPAIFNALTVYFTGLTTIMMGGGTAAVLVSGIGIMWAPIILAMTSIYSMNSLDILLWAVAVNIVVKITNDQHPHYWLYLGVVIGLGLLNKISMLWFGFGLFTGLILTDQKKWLLTRWPWYSAFIALTMFAPYVIWNALHDFPHLEFIHNATTYKYSELTPLSFLSGQPLLMNPVSLVIWIPGLFWLLSQHKYRLLGIIWTAVLAILLINGHSKSEYLSAAYSPLFAAGGIAIESLSQRKYCRWSSIAVCICVTVSGVLLCPLAMPCLPVKTFISYTKTIGITQESNEGKKLNELPQFFADMHGWENMAKTIGDVYHSLPQEEQVGTVVFVQNYGEAGAIDYYREKYDLPPVYSPHNNYWLWGYDENATTFIIIGGKIDNARQYFRDVEQSAVIVSPYAIPHENNLPVYIGHEILVPIADIWKKLKIFS